MDIPEDAFWWMDAQFLPYNDAELVVTSTAYSAPRFLQAWNPISGIPQGRIILLDTSSLPASKLKVVF